MTFGPSLRERTIIRKLGKIVPACRHFILHAACVRVKKVEERKKKPIRYNAIERERERERERDREREREKEREQEQNKQTDR